MSWSHVRALVAKELIDYRRNRYVLYSLIALPLITFVLPVLALASLSAAAPPPLLHKVAASAEIEFLLAPLVLPSVLAGYAILGERDQGTLEPVLTTPITAGEFFLAKLLAVLAPTLAAAWGLYVLALAIIALTAPSAVIAELVTASSIARQLGLDALLAGWAVLVGLVASTRASDVRAAQQLASLASLPVLVVVVVVVEGGIHLVPGVGFALAGLVAFVDIAGLVLLARRFDAERLLAPRPPKRARRSFGGSPRRD